MGMPLGFPVEPVVHKITATSSALGVEISTGSSTSNAASSQCSKECSATKCGSFGSSSMITFGTNFFKTSYKAGSVRTNAGSVKRTYSSMRVSACFGEIGTMIMSIETAAQKKSNISE